MNKPLALFDIDGTMIPGTTYFRVLDAQLREEFVSEACVADAYSAYGKYKQGSISYEQLVENLLDIYAQGIQGRTAKEVENSIDAILGDTTDFYQYVAPTIELLRNTHEIVVISGSPHFMADAVRQRFGIEHSYSSVYEVVDGIITGRVETYLATRQQKHRAIQHVITGHEYKGSVAFGDSEGDLEVLKSVEHPICISPTAGLRHHAVKHNWTIVDADSTLNNDKPLKVIIEPLL